jgi:hypothetical protein
MYRPLGWTTKSVWIAKIESYLTSVAIFSGTTHACSEFWDRSSA